jgi:hypothetical protein
VLLELRVAGYQPCEIEKLFEKIRPILIFVESTEKQLKRQKTYHQKEMFQKVMPCMHLLLEIIKRH